MGVCMAKKKPYTKDDLCFALEYAADFIEFEEWNEPADRKRVEAAYKEVGRRLRRMSKRENRKPDY
jgi:hypothetical protein